MASDRRLLDRYVSEDKSVSWYRADGRDLVSILVADGFTQADAEWFAEHAPLVGVRLCNPLCCTERDTPPSMCCCGVRGELGAPGVRPYWEVTNGK